MRINVVLFILLFLISKTAFGQAIPSFFVNGQEGVLKIQFIGEYGRIPLVNFEIDNGRLIRRTHFLGPRGYELTFVFNKNSIKPLRIFNITWFKNGRRNFVADQIEITKGMPSKRFKKERKFSLLEKPQILMEVNKGSEIFGGSFIIKYSLISKNSFVKYKISKFPQFDGYIKRFQELSSRSRPIVLDGESWYQSQLYLVEIFPVLGEAQVVYPIELEINKLNKKYTLESEEFNPRIEISNKTFDLFGKNSLKLYPSEGDVFEAGLNVGIIVEVEGNGLLENFTPQISDNIKKFLVDKTIKKQNFRVGSGKKVFLYRFNFPKQGTYSGAFYFNNLNPKTKKVSTISKEFTFEILPKKISAPVKENLQEFKSFFINSRMIVWFLVLVSVSLYFHKKIMLELNILISSFRFFSFLKKNKSYTKLYKEYFREGNFSESSLVADIKSLPLSEKSKKKLLYLVSSLINFDTFHEYDFNLGVLDIYFLIRTLKLKVF